MKIGFILLEFPPLSETFIRREVLALCQSGFSVTVYTHQLHHDPLVPFPTDPHLVIHQVRFANQPEPADLTAAVKRDGIEYLLSSLSISAHFACFAVACRLALPFALRVYSGFDIFTSSNPNLYREISNNPYCDALIVEDDFMRSWVVDHLGANPSKIVVMPNSIDLDLYHLPAPRPVRERTVILSIARFVEKKGLVFLVQAFQHLAQSHPETELWLVGSGPEEPRLRQAADNLPAIHFLGSVPEARTRQLYQEADIFCIPCIRTSQGDADGIPTTVLEAMAFELPVVSSDLLSTPCYVTDQKEGLLTPPGDVAALQFALENLCSHPGLRQALGEAGRARVQSLCDLKVNIKQLEGLILNYRHRRWEAGLETLIAHRKEYTPEQLNRYAWLRQQAAGYFNPPAGRLLDLGCGDGDFRHTLPPGITYMGVDALFPPNCPPGFPFSRADGEKLPIASGTLDSVILYGVLIQVEDAGQMLAEAARVLKPGGNLYLQECINDPNPIHLNHFTETNLRQVISEHFHVLDAFAADHMYLLVKAQKPETHDLRVGANPLISIAIPVYNRKEYIQRSIDSVLNQTYHPVEVVVVDDGSTDGTRQVLESYGGAIKVIYSAKNSGIAATKNTALRNTSENARYVGILDSDDFYLPQFVEKCAAYLENHSETGLVYTDDTLVDATGRTIGQRQAVHPWNIENWLRTCNLRGDTWLARRSIIMQTRLHDERIRLDVDYDLFYQLLEITTFAHLPEYLVSIRTHNGQSTRDAFELAKYHAANLVKFGYSPEYAYLRARRHPEWAPAIEEGIALGKILKEPTVEKNTLYKG